MRTASVLPPPDTTDKTMQKWSKAPLQTFLVESFPDTAFPQTTSDSDLLYIKDRYLQARADGLSDADARARIADQAKGRDVTLAIARKSIATLARSKSDAELKAMLACRESSTPERRHQQAYQASASTIDPVGRLDASDAGNSTAEAISSGWPMRPIVVHAGAADVQRISAASPCRSPPARCRRAIWH